MRLSSCLLIASLSGVHAFYPWELRVELGTVEPIQRRFMPWSLIEAKIDDTDTKPPTLDLKKLPVRRDDTYRIVEAYTPSMADSAPLNQDGTDYSYFSPVLVGSQKTEMWLALDTGAPNTWVFDSKCTEAVCTEHHTFDRSASSSYVSNSSTFSLGYGSGTVVGQLGTDTLSIAGIDVSLEFGQANNASDTFKSYPFDGILGLGRSHTAGWTLPSFMDRVAESGHLKNNFIGFSLSRAADDAKDGEVNFGVLDTTKYDGSIKYTATDSDIWNIPLDDAYVNGQACKLSGKSATIDTGTTYILIPPDDAAVVFGLIPGSSASDSNYVIPCTTNATLQFEFSGVKYSISPKDYVGKPTAPGSDSCISTIVSYASNGTDIWLVGDVFLKNVYTVFDYDNAQIGFGSLACGSTEGNGTYTAPPTSPTAVAAASSASEVAAVSTASAAATSTVSGSSATQLTRGISWSMFTVILGVFFV
jgi:cathepsin D